MSVGQIINIIDKAIKAYESIKKFIGEKLRQLHARGVRNAVDSHDTKSVDAIVRSIKAKRKNRNDAG